MLSLTAEVKKPQLPALQEGEIGMVSVLEGKGDFVWGHSAGDPPV